MLFVKSMGLNLSINVVINVVPLLGKIFRSIFNVLLFYY